MENQGFFLFGRREFLDSEEKIVINYRFLLSNYDKIMPIKDQIQFIRYMLKSPSNFLRMKKAKTVVK